MKKVPDRVWSSEQARLINSLIQQPKDKSIKKAVEELAMEKL